MALPILDGNQSATTLSTILSSGQHITAHTVVSLGTQAITDIVNATSAGLTNTQLRESAVTVGGTVTIGNSLTISSLPAISGTVTVGNSVTIGSLPALVAGTAQIGSVTASISNSVTIASLPLIAGTVSIGNLGDSISTFWADNAINDITGAVYGGIGVYIDNNDSLPISGTVTVGNSVTIGSLPAISGTVTANTFALQGTAVTTSNFTSTTASTLLAGFNATREVLTIFNEGASNLFVCVGATCTTIAYQVRLSSGDYYEVPNHQTSITHSAVFATAGTARVTQVS